MLKFIFSMIAGLGSYILVKALIIKIGISSFMLPILIALVVFIIVRRLLKAFFKKQEKSESVIENDKKTPGFEQARKAYDEGVKTLSRIRNQTRMIKNNDIAHKIQDICKIGIEIFEDIKKDPSDLKKIKTFTNYYLDSTEKIINQYVDLSNRNDQTQDIKDSLEKVEGLLDQIKETFSKQLASLLEDDLLNLDVELSVLKKTMKYEG